MPINGTEYAWEDIQVVLPGSPLPLEGVTSIKYKVKKEKTNIYGRGSKPVKRGRGRKTFEGSITILQSELEALLRTLPVGKDITDIPPFPIPVAYAPEGGAETIDMLVDCEFVEFEKSFKEGDDHMEIELPLIIGDIQFAI